MENSLLQRLSPELRLHLYETVYFKTELTLTFPSYTSQIPQPQQESLHTIALLSTCRQIRCEALPIFITSTTLNLKTSLINQYRSHESCEQRNNTTLQPILTSLHTWLTLTNPLPTTITLDLGMWLPSHHTSIVQPEALAHAVQAFVREAADSQSNITIQIGWLASAVFTVRIPLKDLAEGKRKIEEALVEQEKLKGEMRGMSWDVVLASNVAAYREYFVEFMRVLETD